MERSDIRAILPPQQSRISLRSIRATCFIARQNALPDQISGLDTTMADAVTYKAVGAPLTAEQVRTLIQLQPPVK